MGQSREILTFLLLTALQILIYNYVNISPMVMLSVLPMLILFLPSRVGTIGGMLAAFAIGFCVDFLSDGILGLNTISLIPVAFLRPGIIRMVFGEEMIARKENLSKRKAGMQKIVVALTLCQAAFLIIYVWVDSAGTRTFSFNLARFTFSLLCGVVMNYFLAGLMSTDERQRWK